MHDSRRAPPDTAKTGFIPKICEESDMKSDRDRASPHLHQFLRELASSEPIPMRISGTCMEPLLPEGSLVSVARERFYWPGDVLVLADADRRLIAHRLIGGCPRNGRLRLYTKADNAPGVDQPTLRSEVIGRVVDGDCASEIARVPLRHRAYSLLVFSRAAFRRLMRPQASSKKHPPRLG
jgi:hypothetical protein